MLELYFRFRRFILLVQTKKVISINYSSSTSSWKPWRWLRLDLILSMRDRYINSNLNPLTKFTSSSRSTEFKDIIPWNIYQMIMKTVPISTRIVISNAMKWGIPLYDGKLTETETTTWSEFPNGEKTIVEQIPASEESIKIQKSRNMRITVWDASKKVNHLSKVIWVNYNRVHQIYQLNQNRYVSPYDGC